MLCRLRFAFAMLPRCHCRCRRFRAVAGFSHMLPPAAALSLPCCYSAADEKEEMAIADDAFAMLYAMLLMPRHAARLCSFMRYMPQKSVITCRHAHWHAVVTFKLISLLLCLR